jgi:hypothetical protein
MEEFDIYGWVRDVSEHNLPDYELNCLADIREAWECEIDSATTWYSDCYLIIQALNYHHWGNGLSNIRDVARQALRDYLYENQIAERIQSRLRLTE